MRTHMTVAARRELALRTAVRYKNAARPEKKRILDEFLESTGFHRKHATRLLNDILRGERPRREPRGRVRRYGPAVQAALIAAWRTVNYVCGKRLVPFLPELIPTMERHGHLSLSDKTRARLLELSAATADRIFRQFRFDHRPHGKTTTKSGQLLKHRVPIRTFADWADTRPGFMEADLVAHCGGNSEGPFLHTLVLTDVATGWTECLALLRRTETDILQALTRARQILPFQLVGLDTDNGSEFMNYGLLAYCERETIQFTRGRARRKNDQCFVEQKNGSIVRQLVGYDRYEGSLAYRQLGELYRVVRFYVNFFQPSMKLTTKTRDGSQVTKRYDIAQTPYRRLSNSDALDPEVRDRLAAIYERSDPVDLRRQLEKLQDAFWRHAKELASPTLTDDIVPAALVSPNCDANADRAPIEAELPDPGFEQRIRRQYRKTRKQGVPHTWRTRPDPFDGVWEEMRSWLETDPGRTSKSLLLELQQRRPGRYANGQLRTLQRRVREWRRQILETFDGEWLELDRVRPASESAGDGGCGKGGRSATLENSSSFPLSHSLDGGKNSPV